MEVQLRKRIKWLGMSIFTVLLPLLVAAPAMATDEEMIKHMEKIIQQQQVQIDAQNKAIEKLQQQMDGLTKTAQPPAPVSAPSGVVQSKGDKVSVKLYGQVNRALLYSNDGNSSDYYFVDNDNSSSRIGLLGAAKVNDDATMGTWMEFEYQSNPSNLVNQIDKNSVGGTGFTDRHIDAYVKSQKYGKLSLGKGDTASNSTSEVDLSGTSVIGYSSVSDMAGGILFYDNNTDSLSVTNVGDVFSNFDGLSRDDRIRYDSPTFLGFMASASALSGDGGDLTLRYNAKFDNFKLAAAAACANPNNEGSLADVDNQYSGSASVLHSSGLNLTLAGGQRDYDLSGRDDSTFYYAKLGFRKHFLSLGESRFSIDYATNNDVAQNKDEAESFGFQFVQDFYKWGTECYLGYRNYDLDRSGTDFNDISAVMSGVRVKF